MIDLNKLKIEIFADGADFDSMLKLNSNPLIKGFTTNPTLMKKAGVSDYKDFAQKVIKEINKPISFEVFADDFESMKLQAEEIASWGSNVNVKIPITNTKGEKSTSLIRDLSNQGINCNVTAIFTLDQLSEVLDHLNNNTPAILSIFAGRIADTGLDPVPIMKKAVKLTNHNEKFKILWASPRELLNILHADEVGCHIITVSHDILKKIDLINKDLTKFSLETVSMFYSDAKNAGYKIKINNK
ncbi:MAG: Transaldolase [Alphaproteobacteria bacterium MarineAlpha5_Bin12]|nr:MAG: Transaldolase [Alphaproteobacteria bacterium MarineAlpha5_Bin12]|tara:strand:+ start:7010 stop:7738 length:729 start_codon:yes stop_codon:yes gene_type:complete